MSDYTVTDALAKTMRYEVDEREIYNDVRSEIGILITETVVDADATYSWKIYTISKANIAPGQTYHQGIAVPMGFGNPLAWELREHHAHTGPPNYTPAFQYQVRLDATAGDPQAYVELENTGSVWTLTIYCKVAFKYKTSDKLTHEEQYPATLTVRSTDETSINKYGRRVMNLTWTEGTGEREMQSLADHYKTRYSEPAGKVIVVLEGDTDAKALQIATREVSDVITVNSTLLGMNADCFINAIRIQDRLARIPLCIWELEEKRTYEGYTLFTLDTSELDGTHVLGS